jgi:hypothetical protein
MQENRRQDIPRVTLRRADACGGAEGEGVVLRLSAKATRQRTHSPATGFAAAQQPHAQTQRKTHATQQKEDRDILDGWDDACESGIDSKMGDRGQR